MRVRENERERERVGGVIKKAKKIFLRSTSAENEISFLAYVCFDRNERDGSF